MTLNDGCTLTGTTLRPSSFAVVSPLLVLSVDAAVGGCARSALVREARGGSRLRDDIRTRLSPTISGHQSKQSVARAHAEDNFHVGI